MAQQSLRKIEVSVCKVDKRLGVVFGYAIVCKVDGKDYYDTGSLDEDGNVYSDHIDEDTMLHGVTDFMKSARVAKEMHEGGPQGTVVHSFPLTSDIAKALGIKPKMTGWLIGMQPSPAMLEKFASGELTGFSIGGFGRRVKETE